MLETATTASLTPISEHRLLKVAFHDGSGISPLHVTVLKALADVLELDPTKTRLNLSDHVSISALDSLGARNADGDAEPSGFSCHAFQYDDFGMKLLVFAFSNGSVEIHERPS